MNPAAEARPTRSPRSEKDSSDEYHGIIIRESLTDPSALTIVRILGQRKGGPWTLLRVGVSARTLRRAIARIQHGLRTVDTVPFYAHFYRKDELLVVFPRRLFRLRPERTTWGPAVSYGRSLGINEDELDFNPCRFEEETY